MNYGFFDYKYNIEGYAGGDFDRYRLVYLIFCVIVIPLLAFILRKTKKEKIDIYIKIVATFITVMEIVKVSWESYFDVTTGQGFNAGGILPFDTCSLFIYSMLCAAFFKGKVKDYALCWVMLYGFGGGVSYIIFPNVLNFYPILTFGAFHSLIFHFLMAFTAVFIFITKFISIQWKNLNKAFLFHMCFSAIVIPLDYIFKWDYMLYRDASGIPLLSDLGSMLAEKNLHFITTIIMIFVYFILGAFVLFLYHIPEIIYKNNKIDEN